jgi:hypothetical protein
MRRFLSRGWLDEYIAAGCFDLTVLTLTETAQQGIELGLDDYLRRVLSDDIARFSTGTTQSLPFSLQTFVVPGLIDLIPDAQCTKG